jgi:hypothetical protein
MAGNNLSTKISTLLFTHFSLVLLWSILLLSWSLFLFKSIDKFCLSVRFI